MSRLSLIGCARGESKFVAEWIAYHRIIGFDHIHLGCNDPKDSENYRKTRAAVEPYIRLGRLTWYDWPDAPGRRDNAAPKRQIQFYDHVTTKVRKHTDWVAILDLDEFLAVAQNHQLLDLIKKYDALPKLAGIYVHWRMFGTCREASLLGLQTEHLIRHNPMDAPVNIRHVKSLFRPMLCGGMMDPHRVRGKPGYKLAGPGVVDGRPGDRWHPLVVNHYFCRGVEDYKVKLSFGRFQGQVQPSVSRRWEMFHIYDSASTETNTDLTVFADRIRAEMAKPT